MKHFLYFAALFALLWPCAAAPVAALAFSPDGSTLASSAHRRVDLRSPENGKIRDSIKCDFPRITSLIYAPEGGLIVGGGTPGVSGSATLFQSNIAARRFAGFADLVTSVAASPDGQWLALGSADHSATINSTSNAPIHLVGHSGPVLAVAFTPNSETLITASADRSIKIWTLEGKLIRSFNHHTEAVHALAIRPTHDPGPIECASGSADHSVRIWQPAIGRMVRIIRGQGGPIFALAYTPNGSALFSAGKEGILRQIDIASDQILAEQNTRSDAIYSLAVSPTGKKLATGDWAGKVQLWDLDETGSITTHQRQ